MIQLVFCLTRNEAVTPEEFRKNWKENQANAVREIKETLGAQRATQALTLEVERNDLIRKRYLTARPYDGMITLHFDSPQNMVSKVGSTPVMTRLMQIYQDQLPFVDLPHCSVFYTEEPVDLVARNPLGRSSDLGTYDVEEADPDGG